MVEDPKEVLWKSVEEKAFQGDWPGVIAALTEVILLDPQNFDAYIARCGAYVMLYDFERAMTDANYAIESEPDNFLAYNNRGSIHLHQKNYSMALADYETSLHLNGNYYPAYVERANCKFFLKDYTGAITDYDRAISLYSQFKDIYVSPGSIEGAYHNRSIAVKMLDQTKPKKRFRFF